MTKSHIITALTFCLLLGQISCARSGGAHAGKLSITALTPYRGAVKDLLKNEVGDYSLVRTVDFAEIAEEVNNPTDAVGAIYNSPSQHRVQHMITSFPSAKEADRELDKALNRYEDAHVTLRIEQLRDHDGQVTGRRIVVNDLNTEAMNWTNGSLYCTAVSYTGLASTFAKDLPY
jgi:hypothetical protein